MKSTYLRQPVQIRIDNYLGPGGGKLFGGGGGGKLGGGTAKVGGGGPCSGRPPGGGGAKCGGGIPGGGTPKTCKVRIRLRIIHHRIVRISSYLPGGGGN